MTVDRRLEAIREYVRRMSPILRPAVLLPPLETAYNNGYDQAMHDAQHDLNAILDAD